jgi:SNF2 family DNA or RNA helicase
MDPATSIATNYPLPFPPYQFQNDAVNSLAPCKFSAIWSDPGTGKTLMSSMLALLAGLDGRADQIITLVPPLLISQWSRWLTSLGVNTLAYRGSPKWRAGQDFAAWDAIVLSYQIFKRDHARLMKEFAGVKAFVIIDEAAEIKNVRTLVYKATRDFCRLPNKTGVMLSGTPVSNPTNAYSYITIKSPGIYRSYTQFAAVHITSVDPWGEPTGFSYLELLAENLMLNAVRVRADDVLELPEIQYVPVEYDLEPKHLKLYNQLVEEQLLVLEDGAVIDAVTAQRLYHSCQRLILMPANGIKPEAFDIVRQLVNELDIPDSGEKLVVFTNYTDSNNQVFEYLKKLPGVNPVQAFGGLSPKQSQDNLQKFLNDPSLNVLVGHPRTVGVGVDSMQHVCRAICFLELPLTGAHFLQCIARIHRQGQKKRCVVKLAIANGTIQKLIARRIVQKEDVVQKVVPSKETLRAALTGR